MRTRRIGTFALITVMGFLALGAGHSGAVAAVPMSAATTTGALAAPPRRSIRARRPPSVRRRRGPHLRGFGPAGPGPGRRRRGDRGAVPRRLRRPDDDTASVVGQGEAATTGRFVGTQIGAFADRPRPAGPWTYPTPRSTGSPTAGSPRCGSTSRRRRSSASSPPPRPTRRPASGRAARPTRSVLILRRAGPRRGAPRNPATRYL